MRPEPPPPPALLTGLIAFVRFVLGVLILLGVTINFANVVGRYVFLRPIMWAEEVLVFLMIWSVLLGAAVVTWEGRHLKMDALYNVAPPRTRRWVNVFGALVFLATAVFVVVQSAGVVGVIARNGQRSVVADIPMSIPYAAIPVGFALMVPLLLWRHRPFGGGEDGDPRRRVD